MSSPLITCQPPTGKCHPSRFPGWEPYFIECMIVVVEKVYELWPLDC